MFHKLLRWTKEIIYLIDKKTFKPYIKKKNIEGVSFDFWICDRDGRDWYDIHADEPEWPELKFIKDSVVEKGDVVFECGGHHGCTAIFLSKLVGSDGIVMTFEALPYNCDIIEKNIHLNNLNNIKLERKAVGNKRGGIVINNMSNSSIKLKGKGVDVDVVRLDDYEKLNPTFIKIDVEGFETEVLKGAAKILSNVPKLAIEIHPGGLANYGSSVEELLKFIDTEKYKMWIQWDDKDEPEEFDIKTPIIKRVHLFCIPRLVKR